MAKPCGRLLPVLLVLVLGSFGQVKQIELEDIRLAIDAGGVKQPIEAGRRREDLPCLVLFQYDFCRLDDRRNDVADFQLHFVRASLGDHAFNQIVADFHDNMRHDPTELEFHNLSLKMVAR
jgi:hypothetical protein